MVIDSTIDKKILKFADLANKVLFTAVIYVACEPENALVVKAIGVHYMRKFEIGSAYHTVPVKKTWSFLSNTLFIRAYFSL